MNQSSQTSHPLKSPRKSPKKLADLIKNEESSEDNFSDDDGELDNLLGSLKTTKKRLLTSKTPNMGLMGTKRQLRSRSITPVSNLNHELGFDMSLEGKLQLSYSQKKFINRVKNRKKIERFLEEDEKEEEAKVEGERLLEERIELELGKDFFKDSKNSEYIKSIKSGLESRDDDKLLDFHFIKGKGSCGRYHGYDKTLNMLFDENIMYFTNETTLKNILEKFDNFQVLSRIFAESSMEIVKELPSALTKPLSLSDEQLNELLIIIGLDNNLIKTNNINLTLENLEKAPSPLLTAYKVQKMYQIINYREEKDIDEKMLSKLNRWLFTVVMYLMVDKRVNRCENVAEIRTTCLELLNALVIKIARRIPFREVIYLIDAGFNRNYQLVYRFIDNTKHGKLKLSLMFKFLVDTGFNDVLYDQYGKKKVLKYAKAINEEGEDAIFSGFFDFLMLMSKSKLNDEYLLLYEGGDHHKIDPTNYKTNKREYNLIRCRIRIIYDFIVMISPLVTKDATLNLKVKNELGEVTGLSDEWYYLYNIHLFLLKIKSNYFARYTGMIIPTVTDCLSIIGLIIYKLETDIAISRDFFISE